MMRPRTRRSRWLVAPVLAAAVAACAQGTPAQPTPSLAFEVSFDAGGGTPTPTPTASIVAGGGGGGGGGGGTGGGAPGGGGANTVTYTWSETVDRSGDGVSDLVHEEGSAAVSVNLTKTDVFSYEITGSAHIRGAFTEDFQSSCSHYTDDASGSGVVDATGGLQAGDLGELFEFHVATVGLYGTNHTVRDDSPCNGPNNVEDTEWPFGTWSFGGSGTISDPHHITGTSVVPRGGGDETITWDFVLP